MKQGVQAASYNNGTVAETINLRGFLVGNGVTNWEVDTSPAVPETLGGFDMIPNDLLAIW